MTIHAARTITGSVSSTRAIPAQTPSSSRRSASRRRVGRVTAGLGIDVELMTTILHRPVVAHHR
jgi:hypothetical protein